MVEENYSRHRIDPITDDGLKKSATGLLRVEKENGEYVLYENQTEYQSSRGELKTVFFNGYWNNNLAENFDMIKKELLGQ